MLPHLFVATTVVIFGLSTTVHALAEEELLFNRIGHLSKLNALEAKQSLELAAKRQQEAIEAITTWTGSVELTEKSIQPELEVAPDRERLLRNPSLPQQPETLVGPFVAERHVEVEFAWDSINRKLRSDYKTVGDGIYTNVLTSERRIVPALVVDVASLVRPDGFFELHRTSKYVGANRERTSAGNGMPIGPRVVMREPSSTGQRLMSYSTVFNPAESFRFAGHQIDVLCLRLASLIDKHSVKLKPTVSVSDDGRYIVIEKRYTINQDPKSLTVHRIVCDKDASYMPVECAIVDLPSSLREVIGWHYHMESGLPAVDQHTVHKYAADGTLSLLRDSKFRASEYNTTLSDAEFSFGAIGVQDGDRLVDHIEDKQFVFQNGKPIEVGEIEPASWWDGLPFGARFAILQVVVLCVCVVLWRWRQRSRSIQSR